MEKISDTSALSAIVSEVLNDNPKPASDLREGKLNVLQFLIGQCMAKSKGAGDPQIFKNLIEEAIKNS